jgi:hypothetical protein
MQIWIADTRLVTFDNLIYEVRQKEIFRQLAKGKRKRLVNTIIAFDPFGRKQKLLKMTEWTNFSPLCHLVSPHRYCQSPTLEFGIF